MKKRNESNYNLGIILGLFLPIFGLLLIFLLVDDQDIKDGAIKGFLISLIVGAILFTIILVGALYGPYYALVPILAIWGRRDDIK